MIVYGRNLLNNLSKNKRESSRVIQFFDFSIGLTEFL